MLIIPPLHTVGAERGARTVAGMTKKERKELERQERVFLDKWAAQRDEFAKAYEPDKGFSMLTIPEGDGYFTVHTTKENLEAYFFPLGALPTITSIHAALIRGAKRFVAAGSDSYIDVVVGPYIGLAFECFEDKLPESLLETLGKEERLLIETELHVVEDDNTEADKLVLEDSGGEVVAVYAAPPAVERLGLAHFYETLRESGETITEATETAIEVTMKDKNKGASFSM